MSIIDFTFRCSVSDEQIVANVAHNKARGLAALGHAWPVKPALAVVGGDPDVLDMLDEIRGFDGDIWAINGTCSVLQNHGIDCAFYTIDPHPSLAMLAENVTRAVVASAVDVSVIDAMADNAKVEMFDLGVGNGKITHGPTSVTAVPHLAIERGHKQVSFYGCSGAYRANGWTHAYKDESAVRNKLYVETCRGEFCTEPQFYEQSKCLAAVVRAAPHVFIERSGGLLGALCEDMEHAVVATNRRLHESMKNEIKAQAEAAAS